MKINLKITWTSLVGTLVLLFSVYLRYDVGVITGSTMVIGRSALQVLESVKAGKQPAEEKAL